MLPIVIKPANKAHISLITRLSWQTFFDTFHKDNTREDMELFLKSNFNEEKIRSEMNDIENTFLIAYLGKEAVGYAKLSESNVPGGLEAITTIEISRMYSIKEKIGSGVGMALMQQCLSIGEERKKEVIWLGVWEYNQRAIQFYRRFGFEKFGEQPFVLGRDKQTDWLMKKELMNSGIKA